MNRKLLAAIVSGALAAPMAAQVHADEMSVEPHSHPATYEHDHMMDDGMMAPVHLHEHEAHPHAELHDHPDVAVYGSLRYGVVMTEGDHADDMFELGANRSSRFGIKGSAEVMEGLTAGFHIERNLNASLSARHHNVSLTSEFGTVRIGRQGSPYYSATTWDGSQTLGGVTDFAPASYGDSRSTGLSFSSSLAGPVNAAVLLSSDPGGGANDGMDHVEASGTISAGPVALKVGFMQQTDDGTRLGGTVGGSIANVSWTAGYSSGDDVDMCGTDSCNMDRYGFHLGYAFGEGVGGGNAYVQYGDLDSDNDANDTNHMLFGYSHYLAESVTVYAEYGSTDSVMDGGGSTTDTTAVVALKVDF